MDKLTSWQLGLSPDRMREVDRVAEAEYGISPLQLMEIAGLQTARVARELLGPPLAERAVCILTGKGNNGADGLVAARRLAGWGAAPVVLTAFALDQAEGLTAHQLASALASGVEVMEWTGRLPAADLYLDALLGSGASGAPRGRVAEMIKSLASRARPTLALDVPSGLDGTTGTALGSCVAAEVTVTLGLPKTGLLAPGAAAWTGRLLLADIGIPPRLLHRAGVDTTGLFVSSDLQEFSAPPST